MTIDTYLVSDDKSSTLAQLIQQAKAKNIDNPALLRFEDDYIRESQQQLFDQRYQACPIVIKDNILMQGTVSSMGSSMMKDYCAPYDATVVHKLKQAGFAIIAKAAMDEFAMGSSGENSPFSVPHNVYDSSRVAGGSSSGSAVAVASGQVAVALGTDTGGSVRQPAAFNGIYGLKPSYGAVSRYGVQAMASSFDQVGIFATTPEDMERVFDTISGQDERDTTSRSFERDNKISGLQGLRIGVPRQYFADGLDPLIERTIKQALHQYERQGAMLVDLDIPLIDAGVAVYYILMSAEVSTNLARFDGIKYGFQDPKASRASYHEYLSRIREKAFGEEVKRRILLGSHVLSASEYEGLYVKASDIRAQVTKEFFDILEHQVDVIAGPTTPVFPWKKSSQLDDPLTNYLADVYTVIANITGLPALSLPAGLVEVEGIRLPVGLQLMGRYGGEADLFSVAKNFS